MTLAEEIKAAGLSLGFDSIGIARAEALNTEGALLREWLAREYHGTMGYMARNAGKRVDIGEVLPGARSVIVGTMNYFTGGTADSDVMGTVPGSVAKISRYAWGDDYHAVIPDRLRALLDVIQSRVPAANGKYYVDTGPVLEKAWAVRAGVGWLGKHTNVITSGVGSWFFLGVLIVDIELDPDLPVADQCGTCTACIDACPTAAIVEPYVLDATKCISYLTIELKPREEIPGELSDRLDGWVFGCDVCQDVCPWNSFASPTAEPRFQPRLGVRTMTPQEILDMTPEEFHRRFDGSAVTRTKIDGLKRNVKAQL